MSSTRFATSMALACFGMVGGACVGDELGSTSSAVLSGAVFTSTVDGSRVNANIYGAKEDVYLDGGPQTQAPSGAAALPEGDYYFQVTDPSGKVLLSTDAIECREFHVDADGVITATGPASCSHDTGIDSDHDELGAITMQLMPYSDTPNPGGEYKVMVTQVEDYDTSGNGNRFGFVPADTKSDNFKVNTVVEPPKEPCCGDGVKDDGEACDDGNHVDGDGCSMTCEIERAPCCGDGYQDAGEACDDGNTYDGDGCSSTCQIEPRCGDGVMTAGEECDDGNTSSYDGCSDTCCHEYFPE